MEKDKTRKNEPDKEKTLTSKMPDGVTRKDEPDLPHSFGYLPNPLLTVGSYLGANLAVGSVLSNLGAGTVLMPVSGYNMLYGNDTIVKFTKLESDIRDKERRIHDLVQSLNDVKLKKEEQDDKIKEILESRNDLERSQKLIFLTSRIHPDATSTVLEDKSVLREEFFKPDPREMAVLSLDIRRSTDLMLKAKGPGEYATFISELSERLREVIVNCMGVFDKFTGDGVLAYFPVFYSGENAILNCLVAASECHEVFRKYYEANKDKFSVVIKTGLGIGIDYGDAKLVRINGEQTVVGSPVVYACRLSGAPSNHTFINQAAYDKVQAINCRVTCVETEIEIKNEGIALVYDFVKIEGYKVVVPDWKNLTSTST